MTVLLRAYDPDQLRDESGKWTAGAYGSGGKYEADKARIDAAKPLSPDVHKDFIHRIHSALGGSGKRYDNAIEAIRAHKKSTTALEDRVQRKAMDRVFKRAGYELKEDAVVYRGLKLTDEQTAKILSAAKGKKRVYIQQNKARYVPTTTDIYTANHFGNVRLEIFLPRGTKVLPVRDIGGFTSESEVTLNRGARFRVVSGRVEKKPSKDSFLPNKGRTTIQVAYIGSVHQKKSHLAGKLAEVLLAKARQSREEHFIGDIEYVEIESDDGYEVVLGETEQGREPLMEPGTEGDDYEDEEGEKLARAYNPDQPRDEHGRWGEDSAGSATDGAEWYHSALKDGHSAGTAALLGYTNGDAFAINDALRKDQPLTESQKAMVKELDAMAQDTAPESGVLHRRSVQALSSLTGAGGRTLSSNFRGSITFKEYLSTSTAKEVTEDFGRDALGGKASELMWEIRADKSTRGIDVSKQFQARGVDDSMSQSEFILPRGTTLSVRRVESVGDRRYRISAVIQHQPRKLRRSDLYKFFAAPASATSGLGGYDLDGQRRTLVRLRPKRQRLMERGSAGRVRIIPINGGKS